MLSGSNDDRNSTVSISIRDLVRASYSHQLYVAFIMLLKERDTGGEEFLGDIMNLGKTLTTYLLCFLNA